VPRIRRREISPTSSARLTGGPWIRSRKHYGSLLILTRHNATALSLRSFFNRAIPLWQGYTRYALDQLVDAITDADGDCGELAAATVNFMGEVGKGFSLALRPSATRSNRKSKNVVRVIAEAGPPRSRNSRACCLPSPRIGASQPFCAASQS
jgi:hypothetical protein